MSSNSHTYRFILTPLDRIFFGGEKTPFEGSEYYLQSRFFPQQTGLLGLVRYFVLQKSGLLGGNRNAWAPLIGPESFSGSLGQQFGLIKGISPLSLYSREGKDWYLMLNSQGLKMENAPAGVRAGFGEGLVWRDKLGYFAGYNPKSPKQLKEHFSDLSGGSLSVFTEVGEELGTGLKRPKPGSGVFTKDVKPGITKDYGGESKDYGGESKEDGYFKLEYYRMAAGYAYSFKAELDGHPGGIAWEGVSFIPMGGDASFYRLEVCREEGWKTVARDGSFFYLLSDAVAENTIYDFCQIWAANAVMFRNLKTATHDANYNKRPSWDGVRHGSTYEARRLLRRGSILVAAPGQEGALENALKNDAFEKIGYNHFIRTKELL